MGFVADNSDSTALNIKVQNCECGYPLLSHLSSEAGVCRGGTESHPTFHTISHSLADFKRSSDICPREQKKKASSTARLSAAGRSQAVVGKSRTTGSINLTSVSSTIAKHHQRAAGTHTFKHNGNP